MRPSDRDIRIAAPLIVAAGLAASGLAIFAEELGVGAEVARGAFGWKRISLLTVGGAVAGLGALMLARPRIAFRLVEFEHRDPRDRKVRMVAALIVAAGLAASGLAILAEELGVGAEEAEGTFGWKRITLLVVGGIVAAVGALFLARPRIASQPTDSAQKSPLPDWEHGGSLPPKWFELGLLAQVAAGAMIVAIAIGSAPFWFDEIASVSVAERGLGDILRVLGNIDANMGLYYLLLHAWMWGGDSEAWVRALSALPAVAAIPITAILARRLFGDAVGLVAGFLMVGSMFVVQHARDARAYALALLLITVATLLLVEAVRKRRPAHFLAYGAVSALAVYASPLSGLVLFAHAASLPSLPQARDLVRPFVLTYCAALIAVAPLAALLLDIGAEQLAWAMRPGWSEALDAALEMLAGGNRPLAVAYAALIMIGLVALWRKRVTREQQWEAWRWRRSLVIGWLVLPPVLLFVLSQIQPMFIARYLLTSAPALAIIAAVGLVALARQSRGLAVTAAAVVICLAVLARIELEPYDAGVPGWAQSDRAAAQTIATQSRTGDGIAYVPRWQRLSLNWNLEHEATPGTELPADFAVATKAEERDHLYAEEVSSETLVSRLRRHPRVWLVRWAWGWDSTGEPMFDAGVPVLQSEYTVVGVHNIGWVQVELFQRMRDR